MSVGMSKLADLTVICTQLVGALHDRMTECRYLEPIQSFDHGIVPESWFSVDVMGKGRKALEEVNTKLGA